MGMAELLAAGQIWRGPQYGRQGDVTSTGFADLDDHLGGGWPQGAISELLLAAPGCGELSLLMPLLTQCACRGGWQAWINPPSLPYAPALLRAGLRLEQQMVVRGVPERDLLWATHQALASGACPVVLAWLPDVDPGQIRRLQLAAEKGHCYGFLVRPDAVATQASQAAVRLHLAADAGRLRISVRKRRGGWPGASLLLAV